jgi:hypothetical protein
MVPAAEPYDQAREALADDCDIIAARRAEQHHARPPRALRRPRDSLANLDPGMRETSPLEGLHALFCGHLD